MKIFQTQTASKIDTKTQSTQPNQEKGAAVTALPLYLLLYARTLRSSPCPFLAVLFPVGLSFGADSVDDLARLPH